MSLVAACFAVSKAFSACDKLVTVRCVIVVTGETKVDGDANAIVDEVLDDALTDVLGEVDRVTVVTGASGTNGLNTVVVVAARAIVVEVIEDEFVAVEVDVAELGRRATVVDVVVVVRRGREIVVVVILPRVVGTTAGTVDEVVVVVDVVVVDVVVPELGPPDAPPPDAGTVVVVGVGTLFVTAVAASVAASLPAESCTAFASLLPDGSVYATVTGSPVATAEASVSSTVEPETATLETLRDETPTTTANAEALAVVADNDSEYVKITFVPAVFTAADTNVGAVASAPKLRPPNTSTGYKIGLVVVPSPI